MLDLEEMLKITILCDGNFIFYVFVQDQKKEALQAAPNLLELLSFCFFIGGMSLPTVPSRISLYFCSSFFTKKMDCRK